MDDQNVLTLAGEKRKGLVRLLFSRFFLVLILLVLQVLLVVSFYVWLSDLLPFFRVAMTVFTIISVIYLFNSGMDSSAKLTWLFIIALIPFAGACMLAFTQTNIGHRTIRSRVEELIGLTSNAIEQPKDVMEALSGDPCATDDLARYLSHSGCFPVFDRTQSTFFPQGEDMFAAMVEELKKAEEYIFLEFFIIDEGFMWGSILKILADKAAAGVEVRVMYDGMQEVSTLPTDYFKLLEEHGIKAKAFSPIKPVVSSHYNYRDHRKILVIDGKTAFTGGVNLADEYINRVKRFGHWKDTALMVKGEAVRSFTLMFLQMWNIDEEKPVFEPWISSRNPGPELSDGYVIPYADCPLDEDRVGETVYIDILSRAVDYVHVMTPYLILDDELENAIKYAAKRGVDVKLILPGIPDKKLPYALAKAYYKRLTDAGVKIYEYTPGFVHAKIFVSDDKKAVVGTINLDYRSLYHHYECAAYLYKTSCISDIERDFQQTLTKCRQVTPESIRNEKLSYKILGGVMKFIAPMM